MKGKALFILDVMIGMLSSHLLQSEMIIYGLITCLSDSIYIKFGSKLYRQIVGIPKSTTCAPLVADLVLFRYERDVMLSLSEKNQSDIIGAFNSTARYLDDLLNIRINFFDSIVNRINPSELHLDKANVSDTEASFLDLHLYRMVC